MELEEIAQLETPEPIEPIEPVVEPVIVAPVEPEKEYRYQPVDESGRKLGGEQVIKYRTHEELTQKLVDQNVHLVRALREQTKKARLGIAEPDSIPEDSPRFEEQIEFNPRQLTPDERVKLSRDLLDPEKGEEAINTIFESAVGASPEKLRTTLSRLSQTEVRILAKVESDAFMQSNPDYYPCRENFDAITGWMVKNNLAPMRQNFQLAFDTLKRLEGGIIVGKPEDIVSLPEPVSPIVEPPPISETVETIEPVVPKVVPPPSGLRGGDNATVIAPREKYTLADINKMPAEEYKKRILSEKGFPAIVDKLEKEAAAKARNRAQR